MGVDTLLITGLSTSGCVRATTLDALQYGFAPFVVREACGDRHPAPHDANLFDLQAKYAEVISKAGWHIGDALCFVRHMQAHIHMIDDRCRAASGPECRIFGIEHAAFHQQTAPARARQDNADDATPDRGQRAIVAEDRLKPRHISFDQPDGRFKTDEPSRRIAR